MDARHAAELAAYLHQIADRADRGHPVGNQLRELADRHLVALPGIDPQRDDLRHWTELSDHRLASEIHADAWNLAAGIAVQRDRALVREAGRDAS